MKNKEIRFWLMVVVLNLSVVIACAWDYTHREPVEEIVEEIETEIIQWKDTEVSVEENEIVEVTEPTEKVDFYNVPLSEEIQLHIFEECEKHNISPSIVIALITMESYFDEYAKSAKGAEGLMQVVPKWHEERMERLGCTDLFNPYDNITVGIDYLAELKEKNSDLYWVLMAYNMGEDKATQTQENGEVTFYAMRIVEMAVEIEVEDSTN